MGRGVDGELENGDSGRNGRGRRGNRRRASGREGEEEEHDGEDEEPELGIPPSQQLMDTIAKSKSSWQSQSLTDRYSTNNTYIGFYRIVHDSKYADDEIPPLPHSSTWFSQYEDQPTLLHSYSTNQSTQPNNPPAPPESEDFIIERERISLKCPLTLLPFSDPVTSTKCPHSFEREAIMGMLAQSRLDRPAPGGGRRNRIRYIRCPVCSLELTKDDLKSDPVLLRKVNRAQALLQREEEEAELEGRSRRITLGDVDSGDDEDGDDDDGFGGGKKPDPVKIKQERGVSTFRGFEDDDGEC
ncbi:hypothetical protein PHISCL_04499 [Aspergillus sclerotialis]|uniref:peptidylprolyl isomerase n=1 Tax=Aspergillus sclerotialis TaxID=2070753 RepID=A0A3A2ZLG7_9EURO|nr:hypothetical protein PHISCL_04499 [Aspergillus sclerotialis]